VASVELTSPSNGEQKAQKGDSVFDFLYADSRRIASFLSQFTTFGHLTEIVHGEEVTEGSERKGTVKASAGLPIVASLMGEHETGTTAEYGEMSHKRYDPTWTNALNFLDHLAQLDLINRNITGAGIGEFVLFTGPIQIHDLHLLEKTWRLPSIAKAMKQVQPPRAEIGKAVIQAGRMCQQMLIWS